MKRGFLIVFTGIDGSGKTTQCDLLVKSLQRDGIKASYVWSRWDPFLLKSVINIWKNKRTKSNDKPDQDYNELTSRKKKLLNNRFISRLWRMTFYIEYGIQIFKKIRIKLLKDRLVISDRIFYDSVIDQAINMNSSKDQLLESLDSFWIRMIFPRPDMVIYVDCPGEVALSRKDDAPNLEYLLDRRKLYLALAGKYGWIKVDGTLPVDEIFQRVKDSVYKKLGI